MVEELQSSARAESPAGNTDIPAEVVNAIARAFPGAAATEITPLPGGRSGASVTSFKVGGGDYVLKLHPRAQGDAAAERETKHLCLRIASAVGVAPKVHFGDAAAGITVFERISPSAPPASMEARLQRIDRTAQALRTLHDGPRFPEAPTTVMRFIAFVEETLRTDGGAGLPPPIRETLSELVSLTLRWSEEAPCHRDLNPGNILVAEHGVYFVDWDTAGQGDRFFDISQACIFSPPAKELRDRFLYSYLGRPPTEEEEARAAVTRVMALGFYAAGFFLVAHREGRHVDLSEAPLSMMEMLQLLMRSGGAAPADKVGPALLGEMRREMETPPYAASVRALARRDA